MRELGTDELAVQTGDEKLPIELLFRAYITLADSAKCRQLYGSSVLQSLELDLAARLKASHGFQFANQVSQEPGTFDVTLVQKLFGEHEQSGGC